MRLRAQSAARLPLAAVTRAEAPEVVGPTVVNENIVNVRPRTRAMAVNNRAGAIPCRDMHSFGIRLRGVSCRVRAPK